MQQTNDYSFVTNWRVRATILDVYTILDDVESLPRWWPEVYLDVRVVSPGDARGIGKQVELWTRGWLPYTLRWNFTVLEKDPPHSMRLQAQGDFVGFGQWTLRQEENHPDGDVADVRYDWQIRAEKPLIRRFSRWLKPVFSWNHRWAMDRGLEGLQRELARRAT